MNKSNILLMSVMVFLLGFGTAELFFLRGIGLKTKTSTLTNCTLRPTSIPLFSGPFSKDAESINAILVKSGALDFIKNFGQKPKQSIILKLVQDGIILNLNEGTDKNAGVFYLTLGEVGRKKIITLVLDTGTPNSQSLKLQKRSEPDKTISPKQLSVNQKITLEIVTTIDENIKSEVTHLYVD